MNYWQNETVTNSSNYELSFLIPHCPVVLVLDTSHSMWGQGLIDLRNSLEAFYRSVGNELFQEAQIDIETIRMGENFGIMESFTPIATSTLLNTSIRPKGDTPLGSSLELAISEVDKKLDEYIQDGISFVTPQLIVLSDGKSSDNFSDIAEEIRQRVANGKLICRAIALGDTPDEKALAEFACDLVLTPEKGNLPETFEDVGRVLSQEYEESVAEIFINENNDTSKDNTEMYILDGNNIFHWDKNRNGISLNIVTSITNYLRAAGKEFMVFFDANASHCFTSKGDKALYDELLQKYPDNFVQVPGGVKADDFLLMAANQYKHSIVISNDRYREYQNKYAWVVDSQRLAHGMVLKDKICMPSLNMTIPILTPTTQSNSNSF